MCMRNAILCLTALLVATCGWTADEPSEFPIYFKNGKVRTSAKQPILALGKVILQGEGGEIETLPQEDVDLDKSEHAWQTIWAWVELDKTSNQGQTFPQVAYVDTTGKAGRLPDPDGGYTMVEVWTTWCGGCRRSLRALRAWTVDNPVVKGIRVVTLCWDESPEACAKARADQEIQNLPGWRHAFLEEDAYLPMAKSLDIIDAGGAGYFLDPDGCIVHSRIGTTILADVINGTLRRGERCRTIDR